MKWSRGEDNLKIPVYTLLRLYLPFHCHADHGVTGAEQRQLSLSWSPSAVSTPLGAPWLSPQIRFSHLCLPGGRARVYPHAGGFLPPGPLSHAFEPTQVWWLEAKGIALVGGGCWSSSPPPTFCDTPLYWHRTPSRSSPLKCRLLFTPELLCMTARLVLKGHFSFLRFAVLSAPAVQSTDRQARVSTLQLAFSAMGGC